MKRQHSVSWATLVRHIIVIALGCLASVGTAHGQADDIFLCIAGVPGSSTDEEFAGCSNVFKYSQAVEVQISPARGAGGGAGRVTGCGEAVVIKPIDAASPVLFISTLTVRLFPSATVHFRTNGESPREYLTFELRNVFVKGIANEESSNGADASQLPRGMETLTLPGERVLYTFIPEGADGGASVPIQGAYDCRANKSL